MSPECTCTSPEHHAVNCAAYPANWEAVCPCCHVQRPAADINPNAKPGYDRRLIGGANEYAECRVCKGKVRPL
jgi:hypothetical protein